MYDVLFGCPLTNGIRVQAFFAFEWFLTQLETSLSISHESRSKPLTCSTMLISKKFHVYLGAAPLKDLSSTSAQRARRRQRGGGAPWARAANFVKKLPLIVNVTYLELNSFSASMWDSCSKSDSKKSQCIDWCIQTHQICVNKHGYDIHIEFEVSLHFWPIWPTVRRGTVIGIFSVTNSVTRQTFDSGGIWFIEIECLKQYLLADYTVINY